MLVARILAEERVVPTRCLCTALQNVTADDVQRVARMYLVDKQRTTGWFLPKNEETR